MPTTTDETTADREVAERADLVARSIAKDFAPAQAREQAKAARVRAGGSDPEQSAIEQRLAELLDERADAWDKQRAAEARARGKTHGRVPVHVTGGGAAFGNDIPHTIKRGSFVAYHTTPDVPDQFGIVVRLHPAADDNKRYLADLFVIPIVEGSSAATITNVTFGDGQGQFGELPKDADDIGRGPEGNVVARPWQHE